MNENIPMEYTLPLEVTTFDCGPDDRMRLSAVLRYQQEAAERQLAPFGMGWVELAHRGIAFVTSRWHTVVSRLPRMGEQVTLTTWHRERKGPRFFRCYRWQDAAGGILLEGVMQFALISVTDHRLLRGEEFEALGLPAQQGRGVDCADPGRFSLPAEMAPWDTYRVRWSDTDRNGHMNNTYYADLAVDGIADRLEGRSLADVQLHFAGESRLGDEIAITAAVTDAAYVQGVTEHGVTFAARLAFREP